MAFFGSACAAVMRRCLSFAVTPMYSIIKEDKVPECPVTGIHNATVSVAQKKKPKSKCNYKFICSVY